MEVKNRVLAIGASPRKNGNSDILLKRALSGVASSGTECEAVQLRDYHFMPCIGCEKCQNSTHCSGLNDGMQLIYPKLLEARGLVLVSPSHNCNITAWMKAFIDRLYCFYQFSKDRPRQYTSSLSGQGRKMVLIAIGEQPQYEIAIGLTLDAMRIPLEYLGYELVGELPVLGVFDKGAVRADTEAMEKAQNLGAQLALAIAD
ncbi:MAG: flavodoxin family protein [Dehalococcoidales bacterium]|jgi:multimeric flavodoxin WrbA|nr:flavodoxin family protein [Dehalococcoidales bacterium]